MIFKKPQGLWQTIKSAIKAPVAVTTPNYLSYFQKVRYRLIDRETTTKKEEMRLKNKFNRYFHAYYTTYKTLTKNEGMVEDPVIGKFDECVKVYLAEKLGAKEAAEYILTLASMNFDKVEGIENVGVKTSDDLSLTEAVREALIPEVIEYLEDRKDPDFKSERNSAYKLVYESALSLYFEDRAKVITPILEDIRIKIQAIPREQLTADLPAKIGGYLVKSFCSNLMDRLAPHEKNILDKSANAKNYVAKYLRKYATGQMLLVHEERIVDIINQRRAELNQVQQEVQKKAEPVVEVVDMIGEDGRVRYRIDEAEPEA